jgi:hypothetical protein
MRILIIGLLLALLVGCASPENGIKVDRAVEVRYLPQVFATVNIPAPIVSVVRCSDRDDNFWKFNHTFIYIRNYKTESIIQDDIQYRIRMMALEPGTDLFDNKAFIEILQNDSDNELFCHVDIITYDNNITAEIWDEGYEEVRKLALFNRVEIWCQEFDEWECLFRNVNSNVARDGLYLDFGYVQHIEDMLQQEVTE